MEFPKGYSFALNKTSINRHFPNLVSNSNFEIKSLKTDDYNCVAWSLEVNDEWIQFPMDDNGNYDDNVEKYINYFLGLGFLKTENSNFEPGKLKIAIYIDERNDFKHVARLLPSGKWTSKIGDWEDIEHSTLDALAGRSYGNKYFFMEKRN